MVTGLAWTSLGGKELYIETVCCNNPLEEEKGSLRTTGQLGSVMEESTKVTQINLHNKPIVCLHNHTLNTYVPILISKLESLIGGAAQCQGKIYASEAA